MSSAKDLEIAIIGASGFTGVHVAVHLGELVKNGAVPAGFTWAIAGRSKARLAAEVTQRLASMGLPQPKEVVEVDNFDDLGLRRLLSRTKLCLNCTGPFRFLGEPVVHACVDSGCDYIDICGEPEFFDRMRLKYHDAAAAAGVLILHACAFDSVPADLGVLWTAQAFKERGGGACSAVDSYLSIQSGPTGVVGHYATYASAVHGVGAVGQLRQLRAELRERFPAPSIPRVGPKPSEAGSAKLAKRFVAGVRFRFPGADATVVRNTQTALAARAGSGATGLCPHFGAYFTVPGRWQAAQMMLFGGTFQALARYKWGRNVLLKYPALFTNGCFTHDGPTEQQLRETSFTMTFVATGYTERTAAAASASSASRESAETDPLAGSAAKPPPTDRIIISQIRGPEPGYVATPIIFLAVARCVLSERASLPQSGGCLTAGAVLATSKQLRQLLAEGGVAFEVLEDREEGRD